MLKMKKIATLLCTSALLVSTLAVNASAAVGYGDCNRDGTLNILDIIRAKKYLAQVITSEDISIASIDVDRNGNVEVSDLAKLRRVLIGSEDYDIMTPSGDAEWGENWDSSLGE